MTGTYEKLKVSNEHLRNITWVSALGMRNLFAHIINCWLAKLLDPVDLACHIKWLLAYANPEEFRQASRAKTISE
jgi:hypothetical protein